MSTNTIPVFDAARLSRASNGNTAQQVEVLALFLAEAQRLMQQVEDAPDGQVRGERLRALIALARNTGAAKLAHEARALETQIAADEPDLAQLRQAVDETVAYVRQAGI
jgi:HPt (histidine-containing phosphotransfer) domain-containing protein